MQSFDIPTEHAMLAFGRRCARQLQSGDLVFLCGDLGAGKTTLARGLLGGLGHVGATPSPTYTLIENYSLARGAVHHLDLYRLENSAELDMLGVRDLLDGAAIVLVEWPQRAADALPRANVEFYIRHHQSGRRVRHNLQSMNDE